MKRGSTWTYVLYLGARRVRKKQQKWVGGHRTKKEAGDALVEALERMRTGMWVDPGTMPRIGDVRLVELSPMHLRSLQTELLPRAAVRRPPSG